MDNYVGKRLDGRYEIREIIGVGGMAVVYKAYDNIDDRIVAIKILKEEFLANEEFRRRFKNESKAIAVLSHPNIVKVYDVSLGDKLQYIVMEHVEGITLKEYIEQQGTINWKEAVHFCTQILRALQHAHDKGIVHRDIKPQNIMLLANGTIKVTDFGIARFSRGETRTMTEAAIGSVHYISPEQARGEITDDKADIYSVGIMLYEMITGQLPFESDSAVSVAIMQLQNEAIPPREINPDIPLGLEQITLHAMEKAQKSRYQSAAEMLLDLDELKRNPAIKFDYNYFVDKEPTKFINRDAINEGLNRQNQGGIPLTTAPNVQGSVVVPSNSTAGKASRIQSAYKKQEADEKARKKKKLIWAAIGLTAAVFLAIFIIIFLDFNGTNKIEVPKFVGMNYTEEIEGKYIDFNFDVDYVQSTDYPKGFVCKQSPRHGKHINRGGTVKLEVVSSGVTVTVPDEEGQTENKAVRELEQMGFVDVVVEKEYAPDGTEGAVLRTEPKAGSTADTSDTITVYVATRINEKERKVPDVIGMNYSTDAASVQAFFDDQDLNIGSVTQENSNKAKGTILKMSAEPGSKIDAGSTVNLVISSGQQSLDINVTLPADNQSRKLQVYVANECVKSTEVYCNGAAYSTSISGTQNGQSVRVTLDDITIYTATANFASNPARLSGARTYSFAIGNLFGA